MHAISRLDDGVHCIVDGVPDYYFRLCITERPFIPVPERQTEVQTVVGRMGGYYEHYSYNDMTIDITFNYLEEVIEYKAFKQEFPLIRGWLAHGTQLQFTDEPNIYYQIVATQFNGDVINDMVEYGEFTVTLTLAPFGRIHEEYPIVYAGDQNKEVRKKFYNGSFEPSYPVIVVNTSKNFRIISYWEDRTRFEIAVYVGSNTTTKDYYVDCFRRIVWYTDYFTGNKVLVGNYQLFNNGFPVFGKGVNEINVYTNISGQKDINSVSIFRNMLV